MSGNQNGFYLKIYGKSFVKLLLKLFNNEDERNDYYHIDEDSAVFDIDNWKGQDCLRKADFPEESSDSIDIKDKIYLILHSISTEYVENNKDKVEKEIEKIIVVDWRCFDSCYDPWDLDLPEDGIDGKNIGGFYSYRRYVYDFKKGNSGYCEKAEYLPEGTFVEMEEYLHENKDIKTFLKENKKSSKKTRLPDVIDEIVKMDNGESVRVFLRIRPEREFFSEMKKQIDGIDWYFLLNLYDSVFWDAYNKSSIDRNDRFHNYLLTDEEDAAYRKDLKRKFGDEIGKIRRTVDEYNEEYQVVKNAMRIVAKKYGLWLWE